MKGSLISGLAALGLVSLSGCGMGGGAITFDNILSGAGGSGDDPNVQPEGGGDNDGGTVDTTQVASNGIEYVEVWKVDPLRDADTGEKVGNFGSGNNHFPQSLYNQLRGLSDRYLFRFDTNSKGRYDCPGLRKLNWRVREACRDAGVPDFKPLLVSFMMRKDIANMLFVNRSYVDRYANLAQNNVQEQVFNELYSDEQDLVIW